MMQILGLLGMHFDAAVEFVTNSSLLNKLAKAILCKYKIVSTNNNLFRNIQWQIFLAWIFMSGILWVRIKAVAGP